MDHETFVSKLHKPWYVWTMARAVAYPFGRNEEARTPLQRSGRTRMANAQRQMDDLVLERARQIEREREDAVRCPSVCGGDHPVRCAHPVNHGPVKAFGWDKAWDHGARSLYWMNDGAR